MIILKARELTIKNKELDNIITNAEVGLPIHLGAAERAQQTADRAPPEEETKNVVVN